MFDIKNFFVQGIKNTLLQRNNSGFSYNGPWQHVYEEKTLVDRFHVGEISSAEYTISVDLDTDHKEILKVLVTGTKEKANLVVYSRVNTAGSLVEIEALVNNSYVDLLISSTSTKTAKSKFIYTPRYYYNQNPLQ